MQSLGLVYQQHSNILQGNRYNALNQNKLRKACSLKINQRNQILDGRQRFNPYKVSRKANFKVANNLNQPSNSDDQINFKQSKRNQETSQAWKKRNAHLNKKPQKEYLQWKLVSESFANQIYEVTIPKDFVQQTFLQTIQKLSDKDPRVIYYQNLYGSHITQEKLIDLVGGEFKVYFYTLRVLLNLIEQEALPNLQKNVVNRSANLIQPFKTLLQQFSADKDLNVRLSLDYVPQVTWKKPWDKFELKVDTDDVNIDQRVDALIQELQVIALNNKRVPVVNFVPPTNKDPKNLKNLLGDSKPDKSTSTQSKEGPASGDDLQFEFDIFNQTKVQEGDYVSAAIHYEFMTSAGTSIPSMIKIFDGPVINTENSPAAKYVLGGIKGEETTFLGKLFVPNWNPDSSSSSFVSDSSHPLKNPPKGFKDPQDKYDDSALGIKLPEDLRGAIQEMEEYISKFKDKHGLDKDSRDSSKDTNQNEVFKSEYDFGSMDELEGDEFFSEIFQEDQGDYKRVSMGPDGSVFFDQGGGDDSDGFDSFFKEYFEGSDDDDMWEKWFKEFALLQYERPSQQQMLHVTDPKFQLALDRVLKNKTQMPVKVTVVIYEHDKLQLAKNHKVQLAQEFDCRSFQGFQKELKEMLQVEQKYGLSLKTLHEIFQMLSNSVEVDIPYTMLEEHASSLVYAYGRAGFEPAPDTPYYDRLNMLKESHDTSKMSDDQIKNLLNFMTEYGNKKPPLNTSRNRLATDVQMFKDDHTFTHENMMHQFTVQNSNLVYLQENWVGMIYQGYHEEVFPMFSKGELSFGEMAAYQEKSQKIEYLQEISLYKTHGFDFLVEDNLEELFGDWKEKVKAIIQMKQEVNLKYMGSMDIESYTKELEERVDEYISLKLEEERQPESSSLRAPVNTRDTDLKFRSIRAKQDLLYYLQKDDTDSPSGFFKRFFTQQIQSNTLQPDQIKFAGSPHYQQLMQKSGATYFYTKDYVMKGLKAFEVDESIQSQQQQSILDQYYKSGNKHLKEEGRMYEKQEMKNYPEFLIFMGDVRFLQNSSVQPTTTDSPNMSMNQFFNKYIKPSLKQFDDLGSQMQSEKAKKQSRNKKPSRDKKGSQGYLKKNMNKKQQQNRNPRDDENEKIFLDEQNLNDFDDDYEVSAQDTLYDGKTSDLVQIVTIDSDGQIRNLPSEALEFLSKYLRDSPNIKIEIKDQHVSISNNREASSGGNNESVKEELIEILSQLEQAGSTNKSRKRSNNQRVNINKTSKENNNQDFLGYNSGNTVLDSLRKQQEKNEQQRLKQEIQQIFKKREEIQMEQYQSADKYSSFRDFLETNIDFVKMHLKVQLALDNIAQQQKFQIPYETVNRAQKKAFINQLMQQGILSIQNNFKIAEHLYNDPQCKFEELEQQFQKYIAMIPGFDQQVKYRKQQTEKEIVRIEALKKVLSNCDYQVLSSESGKDVTVEQIKKIKLTDKADWDFKITTQLLEGKIENQFRGNFQGFNNQ